ncbi:hypothetical protein [Nonomuraea sp. SBT364]|uniref:hypothetical protein n=1 Tax=Nonomuraea sp. SBT364 TaxID=1580530 RepID=UPI00066CDCFE|nr:hypothetical protein [Nonomuraea sp. SBT364]
MSTTTVTAFKTIPVTGAGLKDGPRGHLIAINGMAAAITDITKKPNGEHVIDWEQIDNPIDEPPVVGIIHLPDGATVDCIRRSDWLDAQDGEAR